MAFEPENERLEGGERYLSMLERGPEPFKPELRQGMPSDPLSYINRIPTMMEGFNREYPEASFMERIGSSFADGLGGLLGYIQNLRGYGPVYGEGDDSLWETTQIYPDNTQEIGQSGSGDNPKPEDYPQY